MLRPSSPVIPACAGIRPPLPAGEGRGEGSHPAPAAGILPGQPGGADARACYTRRYMESGPDLTGALSPDRELARHAAFALYTLLWLEATAAVPQRLGAADQRRRPAGADLPGPEVLAATLRDVTARWPRLFPYFAAPGACDAVAGVVSRSLAAALGVAARPAPGRHRAAGALRDRPDGARRRLPGRRHRHDPRSAGRQRVPG